MNNNKRFLFTADSRGVLLGEYLKKIWKQICCALNNKKKKNVKKKCKKSNIFQRSTN